MWIFFCFVFLEYCLSRAVALRGADDGPFRAGHVAQSFAADCRLRRARPSQHVQVRRAAPALRADHGGADLRQQRHVARPRPVLAAARAAHQPPRP